MIDSLKNYINKIIEYIKYYLFSFGVYIFRNIFGYKKLDDYSNLVKATFPYFGAENSKFHQMFG